MYLCSDGHDEIAHEGRKCPACIEINEKDKQIHHLGTIIDKLEIDIEDHIKEAETLTARIESLEDEVEKLNEEVDQWQSQQGRTDQ